MKINSWFLVDGLGRLLLCLVLLIGVDLLIDWMFRMDRAQRAVMLAIAVIVLAWVSYRRVIRPLSCRVSDDALCLEVEDHNEQLRQGLISAVQFSRMQNVESLGISPAMVEATIDHGLRAAEHVAFDRILRSKRFFANVALLIATLLCLAGVAVSAVYTQPMGIWFNRNVLLGNREWPQNVYLIVEGVQDGRLTIPRGDDWPLVVTVNERSRRIPDTVHVDIRGPGGRRSEPMDKPSDGPRFLTTFTNVIEGFEFRARSRRSTTPWIAVQLVDRPAVAQLQLQVTAPDYAGGETRELPPGRGPYYVLKGSRLHVRGTSNKPLSLAEFVLGNIRREMAISNGKNFETVVPPGELTGGICQVELTDTERLWLPGRREPGPLRSKRPTRFTVKIRADREPRVNAKLEGISSMVVPAASIPYQCRISDDFHVTGVRLTYRWRSDDAEMPPASGTDRLPQFKDLLNQSEVSFQHAFELGPLKIPTGSGLSFQIEADDNDNVSGPKTGKSTTFLLRVVSEDELRVDLLRREKELRLEFERLLKRQEDMTTECEAMLAAVQDAKALSAPQRLLLMRIQKRQKLHGTNLAGIARRLEGIIAEVLNNKLEEEGGSLQQRLVRRIIEPMWQLADESVPAAARLLDRVRRTLAEAAKRNQALAETVDKQKEIAAAMREILLHMVKAEGFQEAVNLLFEIQKAQKEVLDRTDKENQERIRKILEGGKVPPKKGSP